MAGLEKEDFGYYLILNKFTLHGMYRMNGWMDGKVEAQTDALYILALPLSRDVYGAHYRMKCMILMLSVCMI